ncbi:upstream stimulatory factor 2 [Pectinophora gossypiella]|uniref:BHLH domain-containing protein n=1 Tax=Pectinophora gossypiella TaxID=13191 RepID=A0A1E1W275_PECGO|nr:upstream stimulatory factor 2 [Pectinophora gossypiella]
MALKVEDDPDITIHENSLDNSADSELLGMVDEGSFGSGGQHFLDSKEDENGTSYNFRDISGAVCTYSTTKYKIVHMTEDGPNNGTSHSPVHAIPSTEFYVIGEPMEVFGTSATQKQKVIRKNPLQTKAVTAKKRDDKRRATHNEVERRRRDKINSWITKLAALVPNTGLPDSASKGGILAKACDHITELTEKQKRLEKLEVDNEKLVLEILRLNQELSELRKENSSMRSQLADNCIVANQRPKGQKS